MNALNRPALPPHRIVQALPPRNVAVALLENGTWVYVPRANHYELRVTVNRLGNPQMVKLGHVAVSVWTSNQGPAARNEVWRNAFNYHSNGPRVDHQEAPCPVTNGNHLRTKHPNN